MMNRITATITHRLAASALRGSWAILRAGDRLQRLGAHMEAKAQHLADQWGCLDDVLAILTMRSR